MKLSFFGTGYVGLVGGVCFADLGNDVLCADVDHKKIEILDRGATPIFEPGLKERQERAKKEGRLNFTTDLKKAVDHGDILFICVGTPQRKDGSADLKYVEAVARTIGQEMESEKIIVDKSTVPVGTAKQVRRIIKEELAKRNHNINFHVISNPEFLKEGAAVDDFFNADRTIVGVDEGDEAAKPIIEKLYASIARTDRPLVFTSTATAELIKYASNAMLATRISFMNQLSNYCEHVGADIKQVAKGMGLDTRIGSRFLQAGIGYGGSCLIGDEKVLIRHNKIIDVLPIAQVVKRVQSNENLETLSLDKNNNPTFSKIIGATKRNYSKSLYTITTRMNKSLTVTADHPMIVKDQNLKAVLAKDIKLGDLLPTFLDYPSEKKFSLDVIDQIQSSEEFDLKKVRVRPINKQLHKIPRAKELIEKISKGKHSRARDILKSNCLNLAEYLKIEKELKFPRKNLLLFTVKGNPTYCPAVINMDKDFCRLLGYYASEGNVSKAKNIRGTGHRIQFHFHKDEKEYIDDVILTLKKLHIRTSLTPKQKVITIQFSSRIFSHVLSTLGCGLNCYDAKVPRLLYSLDKRCRLEFLKGTFRGDGHVAFRPNTPAVVYDFGSISKELVHGMTILFHSLGIVPSYKTSQSAKSTAPAHFLRISGIEQIKQLRNFKDKKTQQRIEKNLSQYKKIIQQTGFKRQNAIGLVKVKQIIQHKPKKTIVYSLEVETNQNFTTSFGLIVHNCFPKDVKGLISSMKETGSDASLLVAVHEANEAQKRVIFRKIKEVLKTVEGKKVAIWGLSFKPKTDDIREAPSLVIVDWLLSQGAKVAAFDPEAMEVFKAVHAIEFGKTPYDVLKDADCLILATEWDEFRNPDWQKIKDLMNTPFIMDGRNIYTSYESDLKTLGFTYKAIGR